MYQLVEQILNTLYNGQFNADVITIVAVTLTLTLLGSFLACFKLKGKNWDFMIKVVIVVMALTTLGGATWSFSLS